MNLLKKALVFGSLVLSTQVLATPGVYEINSACLDVGCFSGDNPATRTVEITQNSGTFILTSDIFVGLNDPVAIVVDGVNNEQIVTIDLNGFQIRSIGIGSDVDAIEINDNNSFVTIKNGSIRQFVDGIVATKSAVVHIENMVFRIMRDDAVVAGRGRIVNSVFDCNRWGVNALNADSTFVGDRLYLENNDFSCLVSPDDQDPVFSMGATNICKDNRINYDAGNSTNFEACLLVGSNICNGSICTQGSTIDVLENDKE
jgi:hypothetical protein